MRWSLAMFFIIGCGAASFLFALAETALFSLGKWRVDQLAEEQPKRGKLVADLLKEPQDLLATILLGNTLANLGVVALAFWFVLNREWPPVFTAVGIFFLLVIICEVIPKTIGVRAPAFWALRLARPLFALSHFMEPIRMVAQRVNNALLALVIPKKIKPLPQITDDEYQELVEMAYQQGALAHSEKEIIVQIIKLDRKTAGDVMKPRTQMACISDDLSIPEMVTAARQHRHARLPIYDETPDTIVGLLNTRQFLIDPERDLSEVIEFPSFVPQTMNLLQLLKSLQRHKRGMAIVLDEFGGTAGLVTMEDILEELVGKFRSEREGQAFVMQRLGKGKWRISGTMRIEDFRREFAGIGENDDVDTMGGLMIQEMNLVPEQGATVQYRGLRLTAHKVDERRIHELMVEEARRGQG